VSFVDNFYNVLFVLVVTFTLLCPHNFVTCLSQALYIEGYICLVWKFFPLFCRYFCETFGVVLLVIFIMPVIYPSFIAVVVVSYLFIWVAEWELMHIVESISTGDGQIMEVYGMKTNWCHDFIRILLDLYMFRAHRPIFRRAPTAVHTTIGSVSVPLCSRALCFVHAIRAAQKLNQWLCEQLYKLSWRWAYGPETCRDPEIYR